MEQSNFSSINRELTDDISGTEAEPVLVRVMKGKGGLGTVFVIKIGTLYSKTRRPRFFQPFELGDPEEQQH